MSTETAIAPETGTFRKWWRRMWIAILVLVVLTLIYWTLVFAGLLPGIGFTRITIAPETTYLTEPIDSEGNIDYTAAVNAMRSTGATIENNSVVLLLKAFGPNDLDRHFWLSERMTKALAIEPLPPKSEYLSDALTFFENRIESQFGANSVAGEEQIDKLFSDALDAQEQPWQTSQYPEVHAWLVANEPPIALVERAIQRTHFFAPVMADVNEVSSDKRYPVDSSSFLMMHGGGTVVSVLATRAMWHLGEGRIRQAMQDALTLRRFSRFSATIAAETPIFISHASEATASSIERQLLRNPQFTEENTSLYKNQLRELGVVSTPEELAKFYGENQRIMSLLYIQGLVAGQFKLTDYNVTDQQSCLSALERVQELGINSNEILLTVNELFDELERALRLPTHQQRMAAALALEKTYALDPLEEDWRDLAKMVLLSQRQRGAMLGKILGSNAGSAALFVLNSHARVWMRYEVHLLGFALAEYRADYGRYPKQLADLVPEYVDHIPEDILSGGPLVYETTPDGQDMKVYSIGNNGIDDGGFSFPDRGLDYEKYNECDDLVIRTKFFDPPAEESVEENGGPSETSPNQ